MPALALACASTDCWPGTGDNGEGDEAMSAAAGPWARGRVDTGLILWLCRRLGTRTIKKAEWSARQDRGRGGNGA